MNPKERIQTYFAACREGSSSDIAAQFTDEAVIYDTNIRPMRTAADIGADWIKIREHWGGAKWSVDSIVSDGQHAAIEWTMTGTNPKDGRDFVFRGSEHYRFETNENLIAEIRQYWTFDPQTLDTGLRDYDYE
jgi:hypothetical protein